MTSIILIAAQSIDGFIARHQESGTDFCSEADQRFLSQSLRQFDSMVMGRKTFETLQEEITGSTGKDFLRKICTRTPAEFATMEKSESVEFTADSPKEILRELGERGKERCALLGGGQTYARFIASGCVDALWITIEPRIFGSGTSLAAGEIDAAFQLQDTQLLAENTLLLKYKRAK